MYSPEGFQIQQLIPIVRRRLPIALLVASAVLLASVVIAAILPNRYEAWTTLLVSPQTVSKKLVEPGVEESDLNARLHLMTMQILSRGRLSRVIDEFGLYPEESKTMTREQVIELMRDHIRVEPVFSEIEGGRRVQDQEINTFRLFYVSHSPTKAAAVAQRLANDFIDEHLKERVQISTGTSEFIEAELARLASAIAEVEQRIANVKNENIGSLPEDLEANQRILERTIADLRFAQRDLAIAESDEAFYRQQAQTGAAARYRSGSQPDTPIERRQRLEIMLGEARSRGLTDKHPDIIAMKEELASLGSSLDETSEDQPVSAEQQLAQNESQRAGLRAVAARAEIERLTARVEELESRIAMTPRVSEQLAALERQHEHLYQSFQDFSAKRLEAGVAANMESRQKGEQFQILEAAFPPPEPSAPNRLLIIAFGLFFGLAAGGGAALLLEVADTSVHSAGSLQEAIQVPVLAAIPRVLLESDRRRMRRRRLLAGAMAMGLATVVLAGAGAGYWIVNGPGSRPPEGGDAAPAGAPPPAAAPPAGTAPPAQG